MKRDIFGNEVISEAARARAQAAERDAVIAALGWAPEGLPRHVEGYCATTGELILALRERGIAWGKDWRDFLPATPLRKKTS